MGGTLRKGLEDHQKSNLRVWREYVHMKGKSKGVWLKLIAGPLRKRLENHQKNNLCLWRRMCSLEGEKKGFLTKTNGRKGFENYEKRTCAYEGEYVHMKGKVRVFD